MRECDLPSGCATPEMVPGVAVAMDAGAAIQSVADVRGGQGAREVSPENIGYTQCDTHREDAMPHVVTIDDGCCDTEPCTLISWLGPARLNQLVLVGCVLYATPPVVLGMIYVVESGNYGSERFLIGVALVLFGALTTCNVCVTLLVASFSDVIARVPQLVPVMCCLTCVPTAWLLGFSTYGALCLASEERCITPWRHSVAGGLLLLAAMAPIIIVLVCLPRCSPFSSRPPRAVYKQWLAIAETPIGAAVLAGEVDQVAALAATMPLAERQRVFRLRMAALRYEALDHSLGIHLQVNRNSMYKDVVEVVMQDGQPLQAGLAQVSFDGEEGIDAGGLTRAIFAEFSHELLPPKNALFREVSAEGNYTVQPEPCATALAASLGPTTIPDMPNWAVQDVMWHYHAVGRVVGLALLMGSLMDITFAHFVLKQVKGEEIGMGDLETEDPVLATHLNWMCENSVEGVVMSNFVRVPSSASLTLGITEEEATQVAGVELIQDGASIMVTDENKVDYVNRVVQHKLVTSVAPQIEAFRQGILDVVPQACLSLLDVGELQMEISGGGLDCMGGDEHARVVKDWRDHTQYMGAYARQRNVHDIHPVVRWFWELIDTDDPEIRRDIPLDALLRFTTGSSRVPSGGFANLQQNGRLRPFTIDSAVDTVHDLPCASTCANLLHIPQYPSKEILRKKLAWALAGGNSAFGRA